MNPLHRTVLLVAALGCAVSCSDSPETGQTPDPGATPPADTAEESVPPDVPEPPVDVPVFEDVPPQIDDDLGVTPPDEGPTQDVPPVAPDVADNGEPTDPPLEPEGPVVAWSLDAADVVEGFDLGVSAGAARTDSVTVWTRWTGEGPLTARVWREAETDGEVVMALEAEIVPEDGGFAKLRVEGLHPDVLYTYAFYLPDGSRSPAGQVRTAMAPGSSRPVTLAATTCTSGWTAPWGALSRMGLGEPLDAVVHLGDTSYNDGAVSLADYRAEWADTLGEQGYRDLFGAAGLYVTWDDHEVDNNWNPESMNPAHVKAATNAYFETLPNERFEDDRLWSSYRWGDTLELFVLDCRGERKPSTQGGPGDGQIYVSVEQMDWLKAGLSTSEAHFKVILNSVPITNMPFWYISENDRWEGYAAQREELLTHIEQDAVQNVWFLAGDFHIGFVARVGDTPDDLGWNVREVAVGPAGNLNPVGLLPFPSPQFDFQHADAQAATWLTFDPEADEVRVRFESETFDSILLDATYDGTPPP